MLKTMSLLAALTAIFMLIGYALAGKVGMIIALLFIGGFNFIVYWYSDQMVLKMSGAKEASKQSNLSYYSIVEKLCKVASLPKPKIYIIEKQEANAFATGRNYNNASIAVTRGLFDFLTDDELEGVIAHELAHIKHRDILISTITATIAGAISAIVNIFMFASLFGGLRGGNNNSNPIISILLMIIAPIAAGIMQMAISRNREYKADELGGKLCGNPLMLANALFKLESIKVNIGGSKVHDYRMRPSSNNHVNRKDKVLAHMYIVNPFFEKGDNLFSTHPSTNNRINKLLTLAAKMNIDVTGFKSNLGKLSKELTTKNDQSNTVLSNNKSRDEKVFNNPWA